MDFGRTDNLETADLGLPPDPAATTRFLERLGPAPAGPEIRLGTPRWADPGYLGKIYPRGTKSNAFLQHYVRSFETIELNSTYYGVDERAIERWREAANPAFRFCPKLSKAITHDGSLRNVQDVTARFCDQIRGFGTNLGPTWALLPETFGPDRFGDLSEFVHTFPADLQLGVELRHPGWFRGDAAAGLVTELFEETGTIAMITDVAGRRDVLHQRVTSDTAMIRFVGNRLHPTDFARIDAWIGRLATWFASGLRTLYLFMHQPEEHLVVDLAEHVAPRLAAACGTAIPAPQRVSDPQQGMLF